jgi:hypothetical protein
MYSGLYLGWKTRMKQEIYWNAYLPRVLLDRTSANLPRKLDRFWGLNPEYSLWVGIFRY